MFNSLNDEFLTGFVNNGLDDSVCKSMDKGKLVQKEIQVKGKNGQTYTRKQWVRAGEDPTVDKQPKAENEETKEKSSSSKVDLGDRSKQSIINALQSGASRSDIMAQAQSEGISWKKSDHEGINWMRASMAIQGINTRGQKVEHQSDVTSKKNDDVNSETESSSDKSDTKEQTSSENTIQFTDDNFEDLTVDEWYEQMKEIDALEEEYDKAYEMAELGPDSVIISDDTTDNLGDIDTFLESANLVEKLNDSVSVYEKNGNKFVHSLEGGNNALYINKDALKKLSGKSDKSGESQLSPLEQGEKVKDTVLKPTEDVPLLMNAFEISHKSDANSQLKELADTLGITANGGTLKMIGDNLVAMTKDGDSVKIYKKNSVGKGGSILSQGKGGAFFMSRGKTIDSNEVQKLRKQEELKDVDVRGFPNKRNKDLESKGFKPKMSSDGKSFTIMYPNTDEYGLSRGAVSNTVKVVKTPPMGINTEYYSDMSVNGDNYVLYFNRNTGKVSAVKE